MSQVRTTAPTSPTRRVDDTNTVGAERWLREVDVLLESFERHATAAGLVPPEGWAVLGQRLRARFGRRLRALEVSLLANGRLDEARATHAAAAALDRTAIGRVMSLGCAALSTSAGRAVLAGVKARRSVA